MIENYLLEWLLLEKNISKQEVVEEMQKTIKEIKSNNPERLIHNLQENINEFAEKYHICKYCGYDLSDKYVCEGCYKQN